MDPETTGKLIGPCVGAGIGILGGLLGTYLSIRNTKGPGERAFAIQASVTCWMLVVIFVGVMLLIPTWHKQLLWIPYLILLMTGIHIWNKKQNQIRSEESTDAD